MFRVHTRKKKRKNQNRNLATRSFLQEVNAICIIFLEPHFNSFIAWDKDGQLKKHFLIALFWP